MAKFGDQIRQVLADVAEFMHVAMKNVKLPPAVAAHRARIIETLANLQEEYPQLIWQLSDETSDTKSCNSVSTNSPPSTNALQAADDVGRNARSGFLNKKMCMRKFITSNKKLWCVVKNGVFYEYEKSTSMSPLHSFPLKDSHVNLLSKTEFELVVADQKHTYVSTNPPDVSNWVTTLTQEASVYDELKLDNKYEAFNANTSTSLHSSPNVRKKNIGSPQVPPPRREPNKNTAQSSNISQRPVPSRPVSFKLPTGEETTIYEDPGSLDVSSKPPTPSVPPQSAAGPTPTETTIYQEPGSLDVRCKPPTRSVTPQSAGPTPTASSTPLQPSPPAAVSTGEPTTAHTGDRTYEVVHFPAFARVVAPPSNSSKTGNELGTDEKTEVALRDPESSSAPTKRWSQPGLPIPQPRNCSQKAADKEIEDIYIANWDCEANAENELSFHRGDRILIVSREYEQLGWWVGQLVVDGLGRHDGLSKVIGLIPKDFVKKA